jgi:hypothetical protein
MFSSHDKLVLPIILSESKIAPFKFWYQECLRDGTHYHQELYCRLQIFPVGERTQAYQLGCKLTQVNTSVILFTLSATHCSLWASLRDPVSQAVLSGAATLHLPDSPVIQEVKSDSKNQTTSQTNP